MRSAIRWMQLHDFLVRALGLIDGPMTFQPLGDARINFEPGRCGEHDIDVPEISTETSMLATYQ